MESSSCDELARAAALVVALAADPSAVRAVKESDTRPVQASSAVAPAPPESSRVASRPARPASARDSSFVAYAPEAAASDFNAPRSAPSPRKPARVTARGQLALDVGSLPRTAEGAAVGVVWGLGLVALQTELALYVPQQKVVAEGAADLWLSTFSARPCLEWSVARLRLLPCAAAELDLLVGQGQSVDFRQRGAGWFPRFGGGAELGYPLSRQIAWITEGWLLAAPWRPTFVLQGVGPVHQPNLLVGRWTTGLELRL